VANTISNLIYRKSRHSYPKAG